MTSPIVVLRPTISEQYIVDKDLYAMQIEVTLARAESEFLAPLKRLSTAVLQAPHTVHLSSTKLLYPSTDLATALRNLADSIDSVIK